ncbi:pyrimidine-specific ribonucleoside hydrolase [Izhakiella capsodis]|uniref:Pyrimidine-specific ribonucleoside hydrolase n=1 Tax=Izhakiella capsodis TaxID=1367852 RepID=A0A1I5B291_9GAMM|nr:pyrimidine-specific ribonucleoside hydrolase [Izhakiella capsodis]
MAGGALKPLMRSLVIAEEVHGVTGLGTTTLPPPICQPSAENAVPLIAHLLRTSSEPVTLAVTGPMSNIALLLSTWPALKSQIARIVFMGGAIHGGNVTPVAEFNIYVDPEAADIVLRSEVPLVMAGLNVTHQALVMPEDVSLIRALNNPVSSAVAEMLDFYMPIYRKHPRGLNGAAMHDPAVVAWLLHPELFTSEKRWVGVETWGHYPREMTVMAPFGQNGIAENVEVLTQINRTAFIELMIECLQRY